MFELEKDAVKKVNNHTFEFADVVAGNIENKEGKVIGVMTVDDITKEGETEVISKRIEVVWVPSTDNIENKQAFHQALYNGSSVYKQAIKGVLKKLNQLPPSAAMAGIYTCLLYTSDAADE